MPRRFAIGPWVLDAESNTLSRDGRVIRLEPKVTAVGACLADRAGQVVRKEELIRVVWPDTFVGDDVLTHAISELRKTLGDDPRHPEFIETIPKRGYRLIAQAVEQKIVAPAARPRLIWGFVLLAMVLLLAATAITRIHYHSRNPRPALSIRSLAVIPLENLSGDPGQNYFADGMTDELITMLAKNPGLRVVSRTSAMQYKGAHRPLPQIARELNVDGILEGSVARSGSRVHITVQLLYAPTDTHVWAESYDRDLSDVISLQTDLSRTIAEQVGLTTSLPPQTTRRINPAAHDAYLLGRYYWFAGRWEKSKLSFDRAIAIDPDYAGAWSGLANYYMGKVANGDAPPEKLVPQAEAAARKAVLLDDTSAEAHNSLAGVYYFGHWDWAAADRESARAVELDPHTIANVHHIRAYVLSTLNRSDEAVNEEKKSMEVDPFSWPWVLGIELIRARQFDAAITELLSRREAQPQNASVREVLSQAFWFAGRDQEAATELEEMYRLQGDKEAADETHATFRRGGFRAILELQMRDLKTATGYVSPFYHANLAARLHRKEETLHYLELAYQEHAAKMVRLPDDPVFDFLRPDPRFQAILRKMGLPLSN